MSWSLPPVVLKRRSQIAVALHVVVAVLAFAGAFALRFDFALPPDEMRRLVATLPLLLIARTATIHGMGVHRGSWRHVSLQDLGRLLVATAVSSLALCVILAGTGHLRGMPRSVLAIDFLAFVMMAGGMRVAVRWRHERAMRRRTGTGRRAIVIGAGQAAERFLRQTLHDAVTGIRVVGLVDDAARLHGLSLHGVPVLGTLEQLGDVARAKHAELLVIAIPSATGEQMRRIVSYCAGTGLDYKVVPSARDLLGTADATVPPLREVRIEDLLGRSPVHFDLERVERDIARKTILVTGGGGSIGSELARQMAGFGPRRLLILERAESPLYFIHLELAAAYPGVDVVPVIGDVTDAARLDEVFAEHRPDYVFHAAAYKHVPMCEAHVCQAVRNNVLGTYLVAECAARHGVQKMVLISTDKAVNPSSVMGATKRLAELLVLYWPAFRKSGTDYRAVRFGNVLGSDGSVIPLFKKQLAAGGPLTVTHPEVTRYFMSIPEAVQLVLQAAALPDAAGRIAMLEMGEPVRIVDLAEQLIRLSGRVPYRDVHIAFTGLRPGEKLNEELMGAMEDTLPTPVEKIRLVQTDGCSDVALHRAVNHLLDELAHGDRPRVLAALHAAVPEFVSPTHAVDVAKTPTLGDLEPSHPVPALGDRSPPSPQRTKHRAPMVFVDGGAEVASTQALA